MSDIAEQENLPAVRRELPAAFASIAESRPGQSTQVEQARAIAEVRAAVMIAMDRPRSRASALGEMREVCSNPYLAERAFFRVPRGREHVNGESIHLARELARCWGNVDYGVKELSRDDARGQSELLAFAWDLQTNARSEITFIVPHKRGTKDLTGTQEIYENNASFAGRRLRETIFAVLPVWFKAEAAEICHKTLQEGGGRPLIQRVADAIAAFSAIGITAAQIEKKMGRKSDEMTAEDVATLGVTYRSIKNGETTKVDEFPVDEPAGERLESKLDALETAHAQKEKPETDSLMAWVKERAAKVRGSSGQAEWLLAFDEACDTATTTAHLVAFMGNDLIARAFNKAQGEQKAHMQNSSSAAFRRLEVKPQADDSWPGPEVTAAA